MANFDELLNQYIPPAIQKDFLSQAEGWAEHLGKEVGEDVVQTFVAKALEWLNLGPVNTPHVQQVPLDQLPPAEPVLASPGDLNEGSEV